MSRETLASRSLLGMSLTADGLDGHGGQGLFAIGVSQQATSKLGVSLIKIMFLFGVVVNINK